MPLNRQQRRGTKRSPREKAVFWSLQAGEGLAERDDVDGEILPERKRRNCEVWN